MTDLTLYEFNALDRDNQHSVVWEHGVHIGERIEGEHKLILYQLFSFYAELYYHMEENALTRLRSFSSTTPLEPYLPQIDITNISH